VGEEAAAPAEFYSWRTACLTLLDQVVPEESIHRRRMDKCAHLKMSSESVCEIVGLLEGLRDDMKRGLLEEGVLLIRAELAGDYLGQAETLLREGYHVPAAVLAGAILEDALRQLCTQNKISMTASKTRRKTIDPMNTDLAKAGVYDAAKAQEIRGWAALRNAAAHGDGSSIEPRAVERMIAGVRAFAGDYLR